jgi:hypothetical protein
MSFFEPPEPLPHPEPPEEPRMPVWWDEPVAVLGVNLQKGFVLARTEALVIAVNRLVAYPTGLSIGVVAFARTWGGFPESRGRHPFGWGEPGSENDLRFGLLFTDGTKVESSLDSRYQWGSPPDLEQLSTLDRAPAPFMSPSGTSGSDGKTWHSGYWATPLPPRGPLTFVIQWLAADIAETSVTIDAESILEAAATDQAIWES